MVSLEVIWHHTATGTESIVFNCLFSLFRFIYFESATIIFSNMFGQGENKIVLKLHNYIVITSRFPGNLKDMSLTMFHKRGMCSDLSNRRGLLLSNFLTNSPMSWLNFNLVPYIAKTRILPDTQIATQQGVQTCDFISYLAGIKCWAKRNKVMVYTLKRDQ